MQITPIKTELIKPGTLSPREFLLSYLPDTINERTVVVVSSKVVAICQGRLAEAGADKEAVIAQESQHYIPASLSKYGYHFTVKNRSLAAAAGIDESNGDGQLVLLPEDPQRVANELRSVVASKYGLSSLGIIIADSTSFPMRRGTVGICLAHSGFSALNNYVGRKDLFGQNIKVSQSSVASALAASAVLVMGEGSEQTPLCLIEHIDNITFRDRNPTQSEIDEFYLKMEDDLYAPFFKDAPWREGQATDEFDAH